MNAVPPLSHPFFAAILARELSCLSQLCTGWLTDALPDHPHDPLQQSQYLVVFPFWASTVARPVATANTASCLKDTMMKELVMEASSLQVVRRKGFGMKDQNSGGRMLKIYEVSVVVDCMAMSTPHFPRCMTLFHAQIASVVLLVRQPGSWLRHSTYVNNPSSPGAVAQDCSRNGYWSLNAVVRKCRLGR